MPGAIKRLHRMVKPKPNVVTDGILRKCQAHSQMRGYHASMPRSPPKQGRAIDTDFWDDTVAAQQVQNRIRVGIREHINGLLLEDDLRIRP